MRHAFQLQNPRLEDFDQNAFKLAARTGLLVPFLGAGASSNRADPLPRSGVWRTVIHQVHRLLLAPLAPLAADHLRRLAVAHHVAEVDLVPGDVDPDRDPARTALQVALLDLSVGLSQAFAHAMKERGLANLQTDEATVDLHDVAPLLKPFETALAASEAWRLVGLSTAHAADVHEKLQELMATIVYGTTQLPRGGNGAAPAGVAHGGRRSLDMSQLAWLDDLVWFTFIHDLALHPTSREFAFFISLKSSNRPPRARARDLARVSQRFGNYTTIMETVRSQFKLCEKPMHESSYFHRVLARSLQVAYVEYAREEASRSQDSARPQRQSRPRVLYPIAFTTNYDRLMEKALGELARERVARDVEGRRTWGYHVVFPLLVVHASTSPASHRFQWVCETHWWRAGPEGPEIQRSVEPVTTAVQAERLFAPERIRGPILVKLHGSPLHDLPTFAQLFAPREEAKKAKPEAAPEPVGSPVTVPVKDAGDDILVDPETTTFDHAIIIAESHYLAASGEYAPDWVIEQLSKGINSLQSDRILAFMGYSISDWNIRMRLFEAAYALARRERKGTQQAQDPSIQIWAINRRFDEERSFAVGSLPVRVCEVELEDVTLAVDAGVDEAERKLIQERIL